jgi:hypothetical protein
MPTYSPVSLPNAWVIDYDQPAPQYWTHLDANGGHPNGTTTSFGRTPVEQWAVRRWISNVDASVVLTGNIADLNGGSGNGIFGRIFVDGIQIYNVNIHNGDSIGVDYVVSVGVGIGTVIDFAIDPKSSNDLADGTKFTATISVLSGDYNHNGIVDAPDYVVWRDTVGEMGANLAADGNLDGKIDVADFNVWRGNFGNSVAFGTATLSQASKVPEPSTILLAMCALAVLHTRPCKPPSHNRV